MESTLRTLSVALSSPSVAFSTLSVAFRTLSVAPKELVLKPYASILNILEFLFSLHNIPSAVFTSKFNSGFKAPSRRKDSSSNVTEHPTSSYRLAKGNPMSEVPSSVARPRSSTSSSPSGALPLAGARPLSEALSPISRSASNFPTMPRSASFNGRGITRSTKMVHGCAFYSCQENLQGFRMKH